MKRYVMILIMVLTAFSGFGQHEQAIFDKCRPSLVILRNVDVLGYGFFIDKDLVITNYQVINKARTGAAKAVLLDGTSVDVLGYVAANEDLNLVLLKVDYQASFPLQFAGKVSAENDRLYFFDANDSGQIELVKGRMIEMKDYGTIKRLQLSSNVIMDNSGFPVLDEQGDVVGISVPSPVSDTGANFAIPTETIKEIYDGRSSSLESLKTLNPPSQIETNIPPKSEQVSQLLNQGNSRLLSKDYKGAEDKFSSAIKLSPNDPDAYVFRGQARVLMMKYKDALADFNKALDIEPDFAEAYDLRGIARAELGDKEGACEDWKRSFELGFNDAFKLIKEFCEMDDE